MPCRFPPKCLIGPGPRGASHVADRPGVRISDPTRRRGAAQNARVSSVEGAASRAATTAMSRAGLALAARRMCGRRESK
jgi:hypothetical protein